MAKAAELFSDSQAIHVPDAMHLPNTPPTHGGDFEELFRLLDELGPAPEQFMLNVCDPLLEVEDIFGPEEDWI